jgi:uncharacterized protein
LKPFFFGDSAEPLFGLYHPPTSPRPLPWGVVLCHPVGQEYLRAYRSLQQLAVRLAAAGFHALRFDYFGCGDSAGEDREGRLARWRADIEAAVEEIEALSSSSRVALVGLRLGATLALNAAVPSVQRLVLWDPVLDGRRYLADLAAAHDVWMREHARVQPGQGPPPAPDQRLGFPLPAELSAEIEAIRPGELRAARALLVTREGDAADSRWADSVPTERLERTRVPGTPVWSRGGDGMEGALVPVEALEQIASWLSRSCA